MAINVTGPASTGSSFQLTATARMTDGGTRDVTSASRWETSNPLLATVSPTGMITVVGSGELDVRATFQGVTGSMHLSVRLAQAFMLSGVVAEAAPSAGPIAGARVQIVPTDHVITDAHGVFAFGRIAAGRQIIEVSRDGYQTWSTEIVLDRDTELPAVTLFPTPPANADGVRATARCNDGSWSWAQARPDACKANGGIAYAVCPGPLCASQ
jgi:carboxypeptidase family protein/Big-like domain-containing protein